MNKVLFARRYYRNLGIFGLLFFSTMAAISLSVAIPRCFERNSGGGYVLCSLAGIFAFLSLLCAWMLLTYYRGFFCFTDGRIIEKGVLRTRVMNFAEIIEVCWRTLPAGGSVVLRSPSQRITVGLDALEPRQRRWMIRLLRSSVPATLQRGWEAFCIQVALPLAKIDRDLPPRDNEVLSTRRRVDRYFLSATLLAALVGGFCAWHLHTRRFLVFPAVPAMYWFLLRFTIPQKGLRVVRMSSMRERSTTWFLLILAAGGVAGLILLAFADRFAHGNLCLAGGIVLWMGILLIQARRESCRDRLRKQAMIATAVEEWDRWEATEDAERPQTS
jgi:hypothetical protein